MTALREEIAQQPAALANLRKYYTSPGAVPTEALRKLAAHWPPLVVFTGMGSSLFAAYPAQAYLAGHGIRAVAWETAELLYQRLKLLGPDTLLVVVSQSGETAEVTRLLDSLPNNVPVLAVANVEASTLARRARLLLPMMAGHETAVSTKTYTCSVAVLMYLAFAIARQPHWTLTHALGQAIEAQEAILDRSEMFTSATLEFFDAPPYVALMSRGADLASVYQGALLLKEVARVPAEPLSAAQFRHGPIEIINPAHRYVIVARQGQPNRKARASKLLIKLAEDIRGHGGRVLLFTDLPFGDITNVRLIQVEPIPLGLGTLADIVHIQLLAHDLALSAGLEPGRFWIAEQVTRVE